MTESADVRIARIDERTQRFEQEIRNDLRELKEDVALIKDYASKWRNGFSAILFLGGIIASLLAGWDQIIKIFTR